MLAGFLLATVWRSNCVKTYEPTLDTRGGTARGTGPLFIGLTVLFNHTLRGWRLDLSRIICTRGPRDRADPRRYQEPSTCTCSSRPGRRSSCRSLRPTGCGAEFLEELAARSNASASARDRPAALLRDEDRRPSLACAVRRSGLRAAVLFRTRRHQTPPMAARPSSSSIPTRAVPRVRVVKLVYELANAKKPVVAWLSSLPMGADLIRKAARCVSPWAVYSERSSSLICGRWMRPPQKSPTT